MERPHIIYHMVTSLDGKVTGPYLYREETAPIVDFYYKSHRETGADAFLCGRVTMQGSFTGEDLPDTAPWEGMTFPREDYVARPDAGFYAVAVDTRGVLNWQADHITDEDPGYDNAYIIEVLRETVDDAYLGFLRDKGISYIFAGREELDLSLALRKLTDLFGIRTLLLEGGGIVGGSFAKAGVIDELSLVTVPCIAGNGERSLFECPGEEDLPAFGEPGVTALPNGGLWLRYKVKKEMDA